MRKTGLCLLVLCIGGLLAFSRPARAEDGIVAVGGEFLMRIRASSEGKTPEQRAEAITDRLTVILGDAIIRTADIQPVTPEDGKANKLSAMQQARVWVKQLRNVLPKINARPNPNETNP